MPGLDDWCVRTMDVPGGGLSKKLVASPEQCQQLADEAAVEAITQFSFDFELKPTRKKTYRLSGRVRASVVQNCVVTLEPVEQDVEDDVDCVFGQGEPPDVSSEEDQPVLSSVDWEQLDNDRIDIGKVAVETLIASIDPFPRQDGAALDPVGDDGDGERAEANPFAVLAKLKKGGESGAGEG